MPHHHHTADRKDIYQTVTDSIIQTLESGTKPWEKSWSNGFGGGMPMRQNGERFRGINILLLWGAAHTAGYTATRWMTYRQALALGGQVKKGAKGTGIVFYGSATKSDAPDSSKDEDGENVFRFLKSYTVFNVEQISDLPAKYYETAPKPINPDERIAEFEELVKNSGARIEHGGSRAFFNPTSDHIQMPEFEYFKDAESYAAVLGHELSHWTKAPSRLDRDFGSTRSGDEGYAKEELCAELSAAFIGADFSFRPSHLEDHAAYIAYWLTILKNDKKFIFVAAAKAQAAADYLLNFRSKKESEQVAA